MAKIVCVAEGHVRVGISEVGDIISIHDDNVELTGGGYANVTVYSFPGLTADEARRSLQSIQPEEATAFCTQAGVGEWSLDSPEEKRVWKNKEGKWLFLENKPKFVMTLANLTPQAKASMEDSQGSVAVRKLILESQVEEKFSLDAENMVEAADLNKVV